jgi:hypothetical protein
MCHLILFQSHVQSKQGQPFYFLSPGVKIGSPTGTIMMEGQAANWLVEMNVKGVGKHDQACPAKHGRMWDE